MTFRTAIEMAFIRDGATSEAALEQAETEANAALNAKIDERLTLIKSEEIRDKIKRRRTEAMEYSNRQNRRLALENVLQRIEHALTRQALSGLM